MVLIPYNVAEPGSMLGDIPNHTHFLANCMHAEDTDPGKPRPINSLEIMPEELIQPADNKDGDTVIGKRVQGIADRKKVLAHTDLPMVLSAAYAVRSP